MTWERPKSRLASESGVEGWGESGGRAPEDDGRGKNKVERCRAEVV